MIRWVGARGERRFRKACELGSSPLVENDAVDEVMVSRIAVRGCPTP